MHQTQLLDFPWLSKEQCANSNHLQLDSTILICASEQRCSLVRKRPILHVYCSIYFGCLHILMQCDWYITQTLSTLNNASNVTMLAQLHKILHHMWSSSFLPNFSLKNAIGLPTWLSTAPMPACEASQSTSNTLSKSGKANMGASITFFFRNLKFS